MWGRRMTSSLKSKRSLMRLSAGTVIIHAIDAKSLTPNLNTWRLNRPLKEISRGTGGHLFKNTNDLAGSMELAANPEIAYQLAFNPGSPDGKFHTLKIRFKSKGGESAEYR